MSSFRLNTMQIRAFDKANCKNARLGIFDLHTRKAYILHPRMYSK